MKRHEEAIQRAVTDYLHVALPEQAGAPYTWRAIPNGGWRSKAEAGVLKATGVKAGEPDLMFTLDGQAFFIEMKAPKGALSTSQKERIPLIKDSGCQVAVCRSVAEVEGTLRGWGFPIRAECVA